jgi:hypothetical protein
LTVAGEVKLRGWWSRKNFTATLTVGGEPIADIKSQLKPTELAGNTRCYNRTVTFVDGTRWSIVSGAPDEPAAAKKRMGVTYGTRHPVSDRVARVIAERDGVTLAEAHWPERSVQKQAMVESLEAHHPNPLERAVGPLVRQLTEAPQITVAESTVWLLPVEVPGRFDYGMRLGEVLTVLSGWRTTKLIPTEPVPLEAALLCWHTDGDVERDTTSGGGG